MEYVNLDGVKARIKAKALVDGMVRAGFDVQNPVPLRGRMPPTSWVRENLAVDRIGIAAFLGRDGYAYVLMDNGSLLPGKFKLHEDGTFNLE